MNFFKRATTSIFRRPGKTIILLLLVFILGTVISGAISVESAIRQTESNLRNNMRPIVTFFVDHEAMVAILEETGEPIEHYPVLTADLVRAIGDLPYVSQVNYSIGARLRTPDLQNWHPGMDREGSGMFAFEESEMANLEIRGTSTPELLEVREGFIEIVDGRTFTADEVAEAGDIHPMMISRGLANLNNLSVNSTFEVDATIMLPQLADWGLSGEWDSEWDANPENIFVQETFVFEVIGIFDAADPEVLEQEATSQEEWHAQMRVEQHLRAAVVSNATAEKILNFEAENWIDAMSHTLEINEIDPSMLEFDLNQIAEEEPSVTSIMELADAGDLEAFRAAAEEILPPFMGVEDLSNTFEEISTSMETLQGIASWILWVAIGATLLILSLLITLFLRDRRHEMGVYLAIGEKKGKIISQILIEVVATAFIGLTLAMLTGNLLSSIMSQTMLRNELVSQQNDNESMGWSFGGGGLSEMGFVQDMSIDDMVDAFDVSLNLETLGVLYMVGLGAIIFSTVVPVVYVVTLNPKKVLM